MECRVGDGGRGLGKTGGARFTGGLNGLDNSACDAPVVNARDEYAVAAAGVLYEGVPAREARVVPWRCISLSGSY